VGTINAETQETVVKDHNTREKADYVITIQ
jgi:hypothetical protein